MSKVAQDILDHFGRDIREQAAKGMKMRMLVLPESSEGLLGKAFFQKKWPDEQFKWEETGKGSNKKVRMFLHGVQVMFTKRVPDRKWFFLLSPMKEENNG